MKLFVLLFSSLMAFPLLAQEMTIYEEARELVFGPRCSECHSEGKVMAHRNWMDEEKASEFSEKIYSRVFEVKNMPRGDRPKIDEWPEEDRAALLEWLCSEDVVSACDEL